MVWKIPYICSLPVCLLLYACSLAGPIWPSQLWLLAGAMPTTSTVPAVLPVSLPDSEGVTSITTGTGSGSSNLTTWAATASGASSQNTIVTTKPAQAGGRFPQFFIIGAAKAATTSLYVLLQRHPQVCHGAQKEIHFFDRQYEPGKSIFANRQSYLTLFAPHVASCNAASGHLLDASPSYIRVMQVPKRMKAVLEPVASKVKMILLLREPSAREFSWYNHMYANCQEHFINTVSRHIRDGKSASNLTINEICSLPDDLVASNDRSHRWLYASTITGCNLVQCQSKIPLAKVRKIRHEGEIQPIMTAAFNTFEQYLDSPDRLYDRNASRYFDQIQNFLQHFDRNQLFIMSFEGLLTRTSEYLPRLTAFLNVPHIWGANVSMPHVNEHKTNLTFPCSTARKLKRWYKPYNEQLYHFLNASKHLGLRPAMEPDFPEFESLLTTRCH